MALVLATACSVPEDAATADVGAAPDSARVATEIVTMLENSAASWNAGDLEGFLDDYTDASDLAFVGSSGLTRGKDAVRQNYRRSYWAEGTERDSLRFADVVVRPMGSEHALAHGRWILYQPDAGEEARSEGRFSLVLRREGSGWRILYDHSS